MKRLYGCACLILCITSVAFGQADGDYRSRQTGGWNSVTTWQVYNAASWHNLEDAGAGTFQNVIPNGSSVVVEISNETTVSIADAQTFTIGSLTVNIESSIFNEETGEEVITGPGILSIAAGGRLINYGSGVTNSNTTNLLVNGVYQHHYNGGIVPTAFWGSGSTLEITGIVTTRPTGLNQTFYNFIWDCASQTGNLVMISGSATGLSDITNDFIIRNTGATGSFTFTFSNSPFNCNVGGSFYIENASVVRLAATSTDANLNITNDLIFSGSGELRIQYHTTASASADAEIYVGRDLNKSGSGTIRFSNNGGSGSIYVDGNVSIASGALIGSSGTAGPGELIFDGLSLQSINIPSSISITGNLNYIVSAGANVDLATSELKGSGTFVSDGNVFLGSTNTSGAIAGNLPVSSRTFNSGSITYNGAGAQYMGSGHPSTAGVNTVIDNTAGVTLVADLTIGGNLTLQAGNLSIGNGSIERTLTLNGNFTPNSNFLTVNDKSNITINGIGAFGTLAINGSTAINNFTLNRSTSGSITLGSDLTIAGTLTQTVGDITLNGRSLTLAGAYSKTNGSFNVDASATLILSGSGALPASVSFAGDQALNTLTVNRAGATLATTSSLTITNLNLLSGTFDNAGTITMATGGIITRTEGSTINNTPSATTSYDIVYDIASDISTGSEIPAVASALRHVTKSGGALLSLNQALTINGNLTLTNGSFNAGSFPIDLKGNFIAGAVSTLTSSVVTFSGMTSISGGSPVRFGDVVISGSLTPTVNIRIDGNLENNGALNAESATTTFGGSTAITGTSTSSFNNLIVSGTLTAPATLMNVAGNFTNNGIFNHNLGTITFNGNTTVSGSATTSLFGVSITGAFTPPSGTLNIAGDLSNTGTFSHNNGTILLNGTTSAQSITGSFTFNNINISNPSKVNNNGTVDLVGTLALVTDGAFDADGGGSGIFTIKSTAVNAGGRIAALGTPGNFTGLATVERYVNGPQGWRYLSMPLTNGNAGLWQSIFPVTGNFSNPSPAGVDNVTSSTAPSIYHWNSSTQAWVAVGSGGSTGSTSLSNLTGYSPYTYRSGNFTIAVRGNVRTGNATIPIASSGFALVPNPYPSAIDWDNITRTGLSSTMSIRVANGVFASYVAGGLATNPPYPGWTGEVASGQSFWIESTGATSLNLTETAKTGGQYQFLRQSSPENYLRIALSSDTQRDEALVWFVEGASRGFDAELDARKMRNGYFDPGDEPVRHLNLSTQSGESDQDYAINALPPLSCNTPINLRVRDIAKGGHTLEFSDIETLSLGYQIVLVDQFLSTEKMVSNGLQYQFEVSEDSASFSDDRFLLRFVLAGSTYIDSQTPPAINIESACDSQSLGLKVAAQKDVYYQFFNGGKAIGEPFTGTGDLVVVNIPKDRLARGANELDLEASTQKACERILYDNALRYDFVAIDSVYIQQHGTTLTSNIEDGNQWYRDGEIIPGANGFRLDVSQSGIYTVHVSFGGCIVHSENVEIQIDPFGEGSFKAFPNPTDDKFVLVLPPEIEKNLKGITLHDLKGMKILDHHSNPDLLSSERKTIDLTYVEKGLYMLSIISGGKTYHLKIVRK